MSGCCSELPPLPGPDTSDIAKLRHTKLKRKSVQTLRWSMNQIGCDHREMQLEFDPGVWVSANNLR